MSVNSELKAAKTIGQRKAFYKQRIPEFSCARKETVHIDILVTSRMSGEFDSRKDSQSTKFEQRPRIFVKLSFRFFKQ